MKMTHLALSAGAAFVAASAYAAPTVFFGENLTPNEVVSGSPLAARTSFLQMLNGSVATETFDTQTTGAVTPLVLNFPGSGGMISATLTGSGMVVETPSSVGRFNTTGATAAPKAGKWFDPGVTSVFSILFSNPISALGFYATDVGDFNGQVTVTLLSLAGAATTLTVNNTIAGPDGALLFFGFIDTTTSYQSVTFGNTGAGLDGFGFDDMTIADMRQVAVQPPGSIPEPATLALVGLSLFGVAASRRAKTKA